MTTLLVRLVLNVIAYWILILIMQYICSAHIALNIKNCTCCTLVSILLNALFIDYDLPVMGLLIALTVILFSTRRITDLLRAFPAFAIYLVLSVIPEAMLKALFPQYQGKILVGDYPLSVWGLLTDVFLLVLLISLGYILTKYKMNIHLSPKEILGCIGLLFFSLIDGLLLASLNRASLDPIIRFVWTTIFLGAFLLSLGYYLYNIIESRVRLYRQSLAQTQLEYLQLQLNSLQDSKENEEQVRRLRHDLHNHLSIIQSLCAEGKYSEIEDYTVQLRENFIPADHKILTGNEIADLVIRSKSQKASEHHIEFTFSGSLKHLNRMEAPDICGLLANAYDNAIEACITQSAPYIRTKVAATRNYTLIQIANSMPHKVSIRSNRLATTKKDKTNHGLGIDIMHRIAHKYKGDCKMQSTDNEFIVKITLLNDSI